MVLHKHGHRLYKGLVDTLAQHLSGVAAAVAATQGGTPFLAELKRRWEYHNKSTQMIRDILMVCAWNRGIAACSRVAA
jgi:cullin 3